MALRLVDRMFFAKNLAMMMQSGIALPESLHILEEQAKSSQLKSILRDISADVENGNSLGHALEQHPKSFDSFFSNIIAVSEESGTLVENLEFLAKQLSKEQALRRKLQSILLYPALIVSIAIIMGAFISIFILPKLLDLFTALDVPLPWTTRALIAFAVIMKAHGILILSGMFAGIVALRFIVKTSFIEPFWHRTLLNIPLLGSFIKHSAFARFFRDLGIMMRSGLPLTQALDIESHSLRNHVFKSYAEKLKQGVATGTEISVLLERPEFSHMPKLAVKMLTVGEKTGKIDESFFFLSRYFEEEIDTVAKRFSSLLEPVLLFVIASIVMFIALSIITPIYSLTGSLQH